MVISVNANIIITYSLAILTAIHSLKFKGIYKSLLFFFGSVLVGGSLENLASLFSGYYYPGSELTLFLGKCPFDVILGWYTILYNCSFFSHCIIGNKKGSLPSIGIGTNPENGLNSNLIRLTILRSILAGAIAVSLDLLIDPVAVENEWWIWQINNIYFLGVPLGNYIGWFLMIFLFTFFFDIILLFGHSKEIKKLKISGIWIIGAILTILFTGFIMLGCTYVFGLKGIRTDERNSMDLTLTQARIDAISIVIVIMAIVIGIILLCSLAPERILGTKPITVIWYQIPSVIMLIFWGGVLIVAALTDFTLFLIGITQPFLLLGICIYLLIFPKSD
ncbi:MAG: carotenoid biosynthesis protein [Promethearchaeota archaeon]